MSVLRRAIRYTVFYSVFMYCFLAARASFCAVSTDVNKANRLFEKGRYEEAIKTYEKAKEKAPDSAEVNYNTAAALYKIREYQRSEEHLLKSLLTEEEALEQKAAYNMGNVKYRIGERFEESERGKAVSFYKEALEYYKRAIELDETDEDAKFNYEFVKKKLEELEQKTTQEPRETPQNSQEEKEQKDRKNQEQQSPDQQKKEEEKEDEKEDEKEEEKEGEKEREEEDKQKEQRQDQQDREKQEQEKDREEKQDESEPEKEQIPPSPRPGRDKEEQAPKGELSEEEARRLLEGFSQEEESKGEPMRIRPAAPYAEEKFKDW